METRINVAELLRNSQSGMKLDCSIFDNLYFDYIDDSLNDLYPIHCYIKQSEAQSVVRFTKYGTYTLHPAQKCVIFPEGEDTWEGFVPPVEFKAGDIVCTNLGNIVILREMSGTYYYNTYCGVTHDDDFYLCATVRANRLATEEERQMLFKAIENNGYIWYPEKKCLEKLEKERFDISTLKPFDKVLVKDSDNGYWSCNLFSHYRGKDIFYAFGCIGSNYRCCIPYEENKHLLGTNNDCDEFYKNWEE